MKARITNNPPPKKNWFDNFDFSIPAKPFASDEEFWKALDDVAQTCAVTAKRPCSILQMKNTQ